MKTVDILRDKFMSFLETDNDYIKKYAERNRENISEDKAIGLIKARLNGDIKKIIDLKEDYYNPVRVCNFSNNNYIEYESNGDNHKTLLMKEYFDQIKPYLKDIIIDLKKPDTWKIQSTIAINFISFKDHDEERVIYSRE